MFYTRAILSRQWGVVTYAPSVHDPCVGGRYKYTPLYTKSVPWHLPRTLNSQYLFSLHLDPDGVAPHQPLIELVALVAIR